MATGSSSAAGAALGAAPDADDSFGAAGTVDAASGTAAPSGVVVDAGGISSSDVELSDEAACGRGGAYRSLRGSGSEDLDPPRKCIDKGGSHGLNVERKTAVLESRGREIPRETPHTFFDKFLSNAKCILLYALVARAVFLLTSTHHSEK